MGKITDILREIPLSVVLKEQLTEAKSRVAALEKENTGLKAELAVIQAENQKLDAKLEKAEEEINRLRQPGKLEAAWGSQRRIPGRMG